MINKVELIGRVGRDPEYKTFKNGSVLNVALATNKSVRNKDGEYEDRTEWHDVQIWGKKAENLSDKIKKGDLLRIEGEITYNEYEDKNGSKQRRAKINGNYINILISQ